MAGSIVDRIRATVENSGSARKEIFFQKANSKKRVRFLQEIDEAISIVFHDKYGTMQPTPCAAHFGQVCKYCGDSEIKAREKYALTIYNYDDRQVQVFLHYANRNSPLPALVSMLDNYSTIMDRDYIIQRIGERTDTQYALIPQDRAPFKAKEKALSRKQILKLVFEAFGERTTFDPNEMNQNSGNGKNKRARDEDDDDEPWDEEPKKVVDSDYEDDDDDLDTLEEDEEEEEKPKKKTGTRPTNNGKKK